MRTDLACHQIYVFLITVLETSLIYFTAFFRQDTLGLILRVFLKFLNSGL